MSTDYMTTHHPDAFLDHNLQEQPKWGKFKCFKCQGYGGWNLRLNQYEERNEDPKTKHFRASCPDCNGWGWTAEEINHEHIWTEENIGRCLHRWTCTICGKTQIVDSSD